MQAESVACSQHRLIWRLRGGYVAAYIAYSDGVFCAYGETQRDRRAQAHSTARLARGRPSSRSGTRSARGFGGGGAPASAQPSALILCAAKRASVASPIPAASVLFRIAFCMVDGVVIGCACDPLSSASFAPSSGARPRGRAFRTGVREAGTFIHRGFGGVFIVSGIVIPLRYYCTAVFCGHDQKISSISMPCWHLID